MSDDKAPPPRPSVIGGRHGSPTVTVALPFSNITNVDSEVRDAVVDLASVLSQMAAHMAAGGAPEMARLAEAAEEVAARLSSPAG